LESRINYEYRPPPPVYIPTYLIGAGSPLGLLRKVLRFAKAQQRHILGAAAGDTDRLGGAALLAFKIATCQQLSQSPLQGLVKLLQGL
jgi:hypothetical protein